MPRFYFHVLDDVDAPDEEGSILGDSDAAIAHATRAARELAAEQVMQGKLRLHHRITIASEAGKVIATVRFGDVVQVEG